MTDNGAGMDAATLRRATEPFFTTKGVGKGTGLGLPMVNGLAEQFGGRFELRSRVGDGTIAEIWLPAGEAPAVPAARAAGPPAETAREPRVILAVDDDPLVLTNTIAMLEDLGHTAFAAESGREALEILRGDNPIDLVLTDQIMPGMTGAELAAAIRAEWPGLPVVLATGYAETPRGVALPRLSKPFGQAELAERIASLHGEVNKMAALAAAPK